MSTLCGRHDRLGGFAVMTDRWPPGVDRRQRKTVEVPRLCAQREDARRPGRIDRADLSVAGPDVRITVMTNHSAVERERDVGAPAGGF